MKHSKHNRPIRHLRIYRSGKARIINPSIKRPIKIQHKRINWLHPFAKTPNKKVEEYDDVRIIEMNKTSLGKLNEATEKMNKEFQERADSVKLKLEKNDKETEEKIQKELEDEKNKELDKQLKEIELGRLEAQKAKLEAETAYAKMYSHYTPAELAEAGIVLNKPKEAGEITRTANLPPEEMKRKIEEHYRVMNAPHIDEYNKLQKKADNVDEKITEAHSATGKEDGKYYHDKMRPIAHRINETLRKMAEAKTPEEKHKIAKDDALEERKLQFIIRSKELKDDKVKTQVNDLISKHNQLSLDVFSIIKPSKEKIIAEIKSKQKSTKTDMDVNLEKAGKELEERMKGKSILGPGHKDLPQPTGKQRRYIDAEEREIERVKKEALESQNKLNKKIKNVTETISDLQTMAGITREITPEDIKNARKNRDLVKRATEKAAEYSVQSKLSPLRQSVEAKTAKLESINKKKLTLVKNEFFKSERLSPNEKKERNELEKEKINIANDLLLNNKKVRTILGAKNKKDNIILRDEMKAPTTTVLIGGQLLKVSNKSPTLSNAEMIRRADEIGSELKQEKEKKIRDRELEGLSTYNLTFEDRRAKEHQATKAAYKQKQKDQHSN